MGSYHNALTAPAPSPPAESKTELWKTAHYSWFVSYFE